MYWDSQGIKANRLISEKSPYLIQHAHNPVNWYPWGDEALRQALQQDKMIFLSIGYATCHWCHVMERESFEDEATAAILNNHFISIKVDREERPDIDAIYMDAIHSMGLQGGWPLNVFLTPDAKPITGGTYFPPGSMHGRLGFREVLGLLVEMWENRRDDLLQTADSLVQHLRESYAPSPGEVLPDKGCLGGAVAAYVRLFDPEFFGFRTDARNKFPPSMALTFLMNHFHHFREPICLEMAEKTLLAMKVGGIYDQVGGGLCRYSTEPQWLVPHFEKMLYDNALFLSALVDCFQMSRKRFFRDAVYDVIGYINRDMRTLEGAVASAEDADSEGKEGTFYLWSFEEFQVITGADSELLERFWRVTKGGNFEGKNILSENAQLRLGMEEFSVDSELERTVERNRRSLLERRNTRQRPLRDDKVLTSWNCLYIQSLCKAGRAFSDESLIHDAESIYTFLSSNLMNCKGRLLRRYRDSESGVLGFLNDYAEMALASLELFRSTYDVRYLDDCIRLLEEAIRLFLSESGAFYETGSDAPELIRRTINLYDGVEPSGNSSMAKVLCYLASLGINRTRYLQIAEGIFRYSKDHIEHYPTSCPAILQAYLKYVIPRTEVVLIGSRENEEMLKSLKWLNEGYFGSLVPVVAYPETLESLKTSVPLLEGKPVCGDFVAYVCQDMTCKNPCKTFGELRDLLNDSR